MGKLKWFLLLVVSIQVICLHAQTDNESFLKGSVLFNEQCSNCHILGEPSLGPDLRNSVISRPKDWFSRFTRSHRQLLLEKDSVATKLYFDHNRLVHTEHDLTDEQLMDLIHYIESMK